MRVDFKNKPSYGLLTIDIGRDFRRIENETTGKDTVAKIEIKNKQISKSSYIPIKRDFKVQGIRVTISLSEKYNNFNIEYSILLAIQLYI